MHGVERPTDVWCKNIFEQTGFTQSFGLSIAEIIRAKMQTLVGYFLTDFFQTKTVKTLAKKA